MAKRGRPGLSLSGSSTYICLKVEPPLYDGIYAAAKKDKVSVPEVIRRIMRREFRDLKSTSPKT
jgi:hypothetical protein